jgi:phospholipid/cholesterol/gamma-HCH transport system substrate-binding protein
MAGLDAGASVKYNGIYVGRVEDLTINRKDVGQVIATISLKAGTPVKKDTKAVITSTGITGSKFIELSGGTSESEFLPPGGEIPTGESFMDRLTGKAEDIAAKVEILATRMNELVSAENREKIIKAVENIDKLAVSTRETIDENRSDVRAVIINLKSSTIKLDSTLTSVETEATAALKEIRILAANVNSAVEKDKLRNIVTNIDKISNEARLAVDNAKLQGIVNKVNALIDVTTGTVGNIDTTVLRGRDDLFASLSYLEETLENLAEFSRMIRENPSMILSGSQAKERKLP